MPVGDELLTFYTNTTTAQTFTAGAIVAVSYRATPHSVVVDLRNGTAWDGFANDTLVGIRGAIGSDLADTLWGSDGDDFFEACGSDDIIAGNDGIDTIVYWNESSSGPVPSPIFSTTAPE